MNDDRTDSPEQRALSPFTATVRLPGGVVVELRAPDAVGLSEVVARVAAAGPARTTSSTERRALPDRPSDAELAEAWCAALDAGLSTRQTLSAQFRASERLISKWAAEARNNGHSLPVVYGKVRPRSTGGGA
jgi:hypothetical protein